MHRLILRELLLEALSAQLNAERPSGRSLLTRRRPDQQESTYG